MANFFVTPELLYIINLLHLQELALFLAPIWRVFISWWWLPAPFILWPTFTYYYLWWRQDVWDKTWKSVLVEIKLPEEVVKPVKAMEQVITALHSLHDVLTWREKWIEGQYQQSLCFEIASFGGEVHFYIRCPDFFSNTVKEAIYSQYSEAEVFDAVDYARTTVPMNIPNKEWDVFGFDMINPTGGEENPYPIKTYIDFQPPGKIEPEESTDPIAGLIEGMAGMRPGEYFWLQIRSKPTRDEAVEWQKAGRKTVDKLVRRPEKPKPKSLLADMWDILVFGKVSAEEEKKEEIIPPEMKLTPGERDLVSLIERKLTKFGYLCNVRWLYIGKREVFSKARTKFAWGFFKNISYEMAGGLKPNKHTQIKVKSVPFWFLDKKRMYSRKRWLFNHYLRRLPPYFPAGGGCYVLNSEEIATLYHFPGKLAAPAPFVERIESKKGEPPPNLPIG